MWHVRAKAQVESCRFAGISSSLLGEHLDSYIDSLAAAGDCETHRKNTRRYLDRLCEDLGWRRLSEIDRSALERWLAAAERAKRSARTRNAFRIAAVAFCNWAVSARRLTANPLAGIPKANEKADRRRQRRALTEDELRRLLDAARGRPLLEARTIRRGRDKGQLLAKVRAEVAAERTRLGWERALIYKSLVLTGLRRSELASLRVGSLRLDGALPYVVLSAADEKSRNDAELPIRHDLASDISAWLADRLRRRQDEARNLGRGIPLALDPREPLFTVPVGLVRILDRDLQLAGIPKHDARGFTVDVHAMRTTFGTHLSRGGVPLRTAQAAMRHSDPSLTANVYTDPRLLDVAGALETLPSLQLGPQALPAASGTA